MRNIKYLQSCLLVNLKYRIRKHKSRSPVDFKVIEERFNKYKVE